MRRYGSGSIARPFNMRRSARSAPARYPGGLGRALRQRADSFFSACSFA